MSLSQKKRKISTKTHDNALINFFGALYEAINRNVNFEVVKCLIIAGPGFVKDKFFEYLLEEAQRSEDRNIISNKGKIVILHSSSPHKHSLKDVLEDQSMSKLIEDTKAVEETRALNNFFDMLNTDEDKAIYGLKHVETAIENGAIDTLLISDSLFRSNDVQLRRKYSAMVERVKKSGSKVYIFSSMHVSGEQLSQLGSIAAICKFAITVEESVDTDSDD